MCVVGCVCAYVRACVCDHKSNNGTISVFIVRTFVNLECYTVNDP